MIDNNRKLQLEEVIKKAMDQVLTKLKERGVKLENVGVVNLGELGKGDVSKRELLDNIISRAFLANKLENEDKCMCPNCFNYSTFEETLKTEGSIFDYATVSLNGREFGIKYHMSPDGDESIMMSPLQEEEDELTDEELQEELNKAVRNRDFTVAQKLLNEIQNRKNKN